MATEHLLYEGITYEVESRWEEFNGAVVYQVGIIFKQPRNIAMSPLRVSDRGNDPREAMHHLVMLINDLKLAGVLKAVEGRQGLYFDPEAEVPFDLQNRVAS